MYKYLKFVNLKWLYVLKSEYELNSEWIEMGDGHAGWLILYWTVLFMLCIWLLDQWEKKKEEKA